MAYFYVLSIKPACIKVGLAPQVFVASKPRFGILATFVNEGARQTVVTSGELKLDNPQSTLPLSETAAQEESWEYDAEGNWAKDNNRRFAYFSPIGSNPTTRFLLVFGLSRRRGSS